MTIPPFAKSFIIDFVETAIGLILALNLLVPGNLDEAKAQGILVGSAVLSALVSATRRAAPAFIIWFKSALNGA